MTFEDAKKELIENGYQERDIRKMKVHLSEPWDKDRVDKLNASTEQRRAKIKNLLADAEDEVTKASRQRQLDQCKLLPDDAGIGVFPVYEDGPDQPARRIDGAKFTDKAKIIHYRLDRGTLNSSNKEFWVPSAYDGVKAWEEYFCAPPWIKTSDEKVEFCNRYYRAKSWPDEEGEISENPIRFINGELALLRSSHQFKGSSDVSENFRKESASNMLRHSEQAFEYLSKAVELSLKRNEPEHCQVSQDNLRNNEAMTDYVDAEAVRIIELAFRAGREAATASLHYRGIPIIAQRGEKRVATELKGVAPKTINTISPCDRRALEILQDNTLSMEDVFDSLEKEKVLKIHRKGQTVKPEGRAKFIKKKSYWDHLKMLTNKEL